MIKINLAPDEELEDKLWWLPMVLGCVVVFGVTFYAVDMYLEEIRKEIVAIKVETEENTRGFEELRSKQQEFKDRNAERLDLTNRLAALSRITESKILRYRPVILLEHLQNLKPEGIWFRSVNLLKTQEEVDAEQPAANQTPGATPVANANQNNQNNPNASQQRINKEADLHEIKIEGSAFDNILVAEFLSALKSTQTQEVDPTALRTMVYFSEIKLEETNKGVEQLVQPDPVLPQQQQVPFGTLNNQNNILNPQNPAAPQGPANNQGQGIGEDIIEFTITVKFREHVAPIKSPQLQTFSFRPDFKKKFTMY